MNIRVLVVDDHELVRQGIVALLRMQPGIEVVGEAADGDQAIDRHRELRPDVTLLDLRMPARGGVEVITTVRGEHPDSRFIVLTTYEGDEDVYRAVQAGAQAYLLKGMRAEQLVDAIRAVHAGERRIPSEIADKIARRLGTPEFTDRERQVLQLIVQGQSNKEIAATLDVTESTVKGHVNNLLSKLGVTARTQAAIAAVQRGFVKLP